MLDNWEWENNRCNSDKESSREKLETICEIGEITADESFEPSDAEFLQRRCNETELEDNQIVFKT